MKAGALRHLIIIQEPTIAVDANGDRTDTWAEYATTWASIETGNGREFFAARQVMADLTHTIRLRYIEDLKPEMRVKYTDQKTSKVRYFNIRTILNPDERNEMLVMQALEVLI